MMRRQAAPVRESCRQEYCRNHKGTPFSSSYGPRPTRAGFNFFSRNRIRSKRYGPIPRKDARNAFRAPMADDVTEIVPHAIPHDGTPVTYDIATLTRRCQRYRTTRNTACDLRRGIIACAKIRRRLSGEKNKCKNKRTHALAYLPGRKGGIAADAPRLKTRRMHPTHLLRVSFPVEAP